MSDHAKELADALRAVIIMDEESSNSTWLDSKGRAVLAAYEASLTSPTMTEAEQKAWLAGRDAAIECLPKLTNPWDAYGFGFFDGLKSAAAYIRALTPPAAIEWSTGAPPVHVSDRPTRKGVMPVDDNNTHTRPDVAPGGNTLSGGVTPPAATERHVPPLDEVIAHYVIDALCRALVPEIVREATATECAGPNDEMKAMRDEYLAIKAARGVPHATAWTPPDVRYVIWSNQHQAYWRPKSAGYVRDVRGAGVYSRTEALDICQTARDGWGVGHPPDEVPVLVSDLPEWAQAAFAPLPEGKP